MREPPGLGIVLLIILLSFGILWALLWVAGVIIWGETAPHFPPPSD